MGTKIQANPHLRDYHSFIDLDASTSNAMKGSWVLENGKNLDPLSSYDVEKVRQTIIEHESTFRNQLRELHRLHGRQQELMNEIKRRGVNQDNQLSYLLRPWNLSHSSSPHAVAGPRVLNNALFPGGAYNFGFPSDPLTSHHGLTHNLHNGSNTNSSLNLVTKDFFHDSHDRGVKRHPSDEYADKHSSAVDFFSCKPVAFPPSLLAEPRKEFSKTPLEINTSLSRTKKKIFGVEISEGNNEGDFFKNSDQSNGSLPWFLKTSQVSGGLSNGTKSSYFMNLDSLQNCSKKFFGKDETPDGPVAKRILDADPSFKVLDSRENGENRNHLAINPSKGLVSDKGSDNRVSELRHCIDLNLSLYEDEALSTIMKADIDLEAPPLLDSEEETKKPHQERDEAAAEALIAISSCVRNELLLSESNALEWFAELVSSMKEEETIIVPSGMDYFEFMTLKLEDTKEEPEPFVSTNPINDDEEKVSAVARRPRRGNSRRGRQRRDFQRDVLPGLATLSRLEVTEDFQAFEEMMRDGGHRRNGRGRRRPTAVKGRCSVQAERPVCEGEGRSLSGWGKRTRRLPRQRFSNAFLGFPVKC